MPHQVALTIVAKVRPGEVESLKELLETMGNGVANGSVVNLGTLDGVHFARFVVLDETTDLRGEPLAASLLYLSDLDVSREHHLGQLVGRQRVAVQRAQRTDRRRDDRARAAEADLARDGRRPANSARAAPEARDGRIDEGARRVAERIGRGRRLGVRGEPRHADRQHRPAVAVGGVARQRGAGGRATQGHRAARRPGRAGADRARRRSVRTR